MAMGFDLLAEVERNLASERVSIVEFAESDEYCDKPLYPRQRVFLKLLFLEEMEGWEEDILDLWIASPEITISPDIRGRRDYLRERGFHHFREAILVGGRRSSKGFVTGIAMAKLMWDTLQLQDPGRFYGIDPTKEIYFSCVAGSEGQAKEFQFADLTNTVENCASFKPYVADALETELKIATPADLAKISAQKKAGYKVATRSQARIRGKALAANAGTLRGSATMAIVIDEMAHMIPGESKASADQVYSAAEPALDQFGKDAMIFCNSSPYTKVGKFYERYEDAMRPYDDSFNPSEQITEDVTNGSPLLMTFQFPSWAMFEGYQQDPQRRFRKAITVSADWNPLDEHHSEEDRNQILVAKAAEAGNPETYKVERRGQFAEVVDAYLNPGMVDRAFAGKPVRYDAEAEKWVVQPYYTDLSNVSPGNFRYKFHLDPSSTTAGFGFAIAHVEQIDDPHTNQPVDHVVFDMVKRWDPKHFEGSTIQWRVVINEILTLARIYFPYEITFDQFQSAEPIQVLQYSLQDMGIGGIAVRKEEATNEQNWFRWETFKTALNHGLVHAPKDAAAMEPYGPDDELKFLQAKNTGGKYPRVDKQDLGPVQTKDMADCMAECVEALIGNVLAQQMRERAIHAAMAVGGQGGYPIGGQQGPRPKLAEMHPDLAELYPGTRRGEQRFPGAVDYNHRPGGGRLGGSGSARFGMNRGRRGRRGF
jgi:hypothetical protein